MTVLAYTTDDETVYSTKVEAIAKRRGIKKKPSAKEVLWFIYYVEW